MKLTVLQEDLAKAVSLAARFASTRSQLPILSNILLSANKTKLNISSTNLEISISIKVGAKIEEEGELSVPSKVFSEIIMNLKKDQIVIESDKEQLKVTSGEFSSKILGMNSADFPKIPGNVNKDKSLSIPKNILDESLPKVMFAAGTDETRPIITGVLFLLEKNALVLVATDGFRLSKKRIALESLKEGKLIIPKGILGEIGKISAEGTDIYFEAGEKDKQVVFGGDDIVITSRLLDGDYPDFEKIIPSGSKIKVTLDKEEFARAIRLASVFARESANVVKIKLEKDFIKVEAESSVGGNQQMKVDAKIEGQIGEDFSVAFNYRFLEEFLHSVSGEEVRIEFTTSDKAAVFLDTKDPDYLHLIMPVRIQK